MKSLALVLSLVLCATASAQNVTVIDFQSQPLMYMKDGKIDGCGVRIVGVDPPTEATYKTADWRVIDVSFNVAMPGLATVKLTAYDTTLSGLQSKAKPRMVYVERGWLKAPSVDGTAPVQANTYVRGEDPNGVLYVTSVDSVIALFKAQADKQQIHIGIRRRGENFERIYAGKIELDDKDRLQVSQCVTEFLSRFSR